MTKITTTELVANAREALAVYRNAIATNDPEASTKAYAYGKTIEALLDHTAWSISYVNRVVIDGAEHDA